MNSGIDPGYPAAENCYCKFNAYKIATETQLLRLIGNTPIQVEVELICTQTYQSKNTPRTSFSFYKNFKDIKDKKFDE